MLYLTNQELELFVSLINDYQFDGAEYSTGTDTKWIKGELMLVNELRLTDVANRIKGYLKN